MWHAEENTGLAKPARPSSILTAADAACLIGEGLAEAPAETLRLAHLDRDGALLALGEQPGGEGTLPIALGQILRDACTHGTRRLVIAHNHPSGDPSPSHADRSATRRLAELLRLLDIQLVDHLIFARDGVVSFRALGLI